MVRVFAPAVFGVLLVAGICVAPAAAQGSAPTPASAAAAKVPTAGSQFVGIYVLTRPGADATQRLTLRLRADGIASLLTETPGYTQTAAGTPVFPTFETGTWGEQSGQAAVHLDMTSVMPASVPTNQRRQSVDLTFALAQCTLKLAADPAKLYGTSGLSFTKQQCTP
jgi:hypothetical protein